MTVESYQLNGDNLKNGNITAWSLWTAPVGISTLQQATPALYTHDSLVGYVFTYDVLNWLRAASHSYFDFGAPSGAT